MQRYPIILLVAFGLHLSPIDPTDAQPTATPSATPPKPFLYLRSSQNLDEITADLDDAKKRLVAASSSMTAAREKQLENILSILKQLPGKSYEEATAIFQQYSSEMIDFYVSSKEFVVQKNEPAPPTKFSEYREILDDFDKDLLKTFGDIVKPEKDILLACDAMYIKRFANEETSGHKHSSSSVLNCIFRHLVVDMATKMEMFSLETSQSIVKSMFMASPEAAASVFVNQHVTGEYLALPLVMAEKMLQVLPRRAFAKVTVRQHNDAEPKPALLSSAVVTELQTSGLSVESVIGFTIQKLVKYYESMGGDLFCKLKAKVLAAYGSHSMSGLAFAGSHVHTCIKKQPIPKKIKTK